MTLSEMTTTTTSDVSVKLDDRIRLLSAVLALTRWPDDAQTKRPHGTHLHARATRKRLADFREHDAVRALQGLLDKGAPLEALFTMVMAIRWPELTVDKLPSWTPPRFDEHLRAFYTEANLAAWWSEEQTPWQKALKEASRMFEKVNFKPFLKPFVGDIPEQLTYYPNISYPSDYELGLRLGHELACVAPPRLAWGDSPPWPFDEDPAHIYRSALSQYGRLLLLNVLRANPAKLEEASAQPLPISEQLQAQYPTWSEQFARLFIAGAVAIYLEDHVSAKEASAYILMESKVYNMTSLPGVISVLRRYLGEVQAGRYKELIDFLPLFPKQLRIANRIIKL